MSSDGRRSRYNYRAAARWETVDKGGAGAHVSSGSVNEAAGKRRRAAPWEITSCEHDAAEQAHRPFQVERHAVQCEFGSHCSKPAAVKAFEALAFAQFG